MLLKTAFVYRGINFMTLFVLSLSAVGVSRMLVCLLT